MKWHKKESMNVKINEIIQSNDHREKRVKKNEQSIRDLRHQASNIYIMGISMEMERKDQRKNLNK